VIKAAQAESPRPRSLAKKAKQNAQAYYLHGLHSQYLVSKTAQALGHLFLKMLIY